MATLRHMPLNLDRPTPALITRALDMAVHLPTEGMRPLRVQVVGRDGRLLGAGVLHGDEQAAFLRDQLQILGTFDLFPASQAQERGCDVLLKEAAGRQDGVEMLLSSSRTAWPPRVAKKESWPPSL